jgi:4-hydroxy-tetrahydrodipicolinate synthase
MAHFGHVLTAMVTPMRDDGSVDFDEAQRLAKWLVANGNDGLVIAGTTGESSTLTDPEKIALWRAVREAVTAPVIAGTGSNDTAHSVHLTKEATRIGVDGILAVCPYYNRPSQSGIAAHIEAMANATNLPVVMYDIPVRSGRKINSDTMIDLVRSNSNIVAVKDAAGNPAETAVLMEKMSAAGHSSFELYSGDDGLTLPFLSIGGSGVIGVATHWAGEDHTEMMKRWFAGDADGARRVNSRLIESFAFETGDSAPNPLPTKAMMQHLGFKVGSARLPMGPAPQSVHDNAVNVYENLLKRRAETK